MRYCVLVFAAFLSITMALKKGGLSCQTNRDCLSGYCAPGIGPVLQLNGYCAKESAVPGKIGDFGKCYSDLSCYSGVCGIQIAYPSTKRCSPAGSRQGTVRGGGACYRDKDCESGHCIAQQDAKYYCATSSPQPGLIGGGGPCRSDSQCFSGYCANWGNAPNGMCAKDSPKKGLIGGGGPCETDRQCYSAYCWKRGGQYGNCAKDSPKQNIIGGGGPCKVDRQCYSGFCFKNAVCSLDSSVQGKIGPMGVCLSDSQCENHQCIGKTSNRDSYGNCYYTAKDTAYCGGLASSNGCYNAMPLCGKFICQVCNPKKCRGG